MTRTRTRRTATLAATLLLAAGLGATGAGAAGAQPEQPQPQPQSQQIASSVLGTDYKLTLTALRSDQDPNAASVRLQVFTQTGGGTWRESDRVTVGEVEGWFWYPLTGRGAVCELSTAGTEPAPLTVSLLVTPSIGCSEPTHYLVKEGRVYAD
ncbi:hypothetical protein [Streptomyces sp. NPDC088789]|uniref:hypothetical protein n=1 Tax=Streptomyces sp. NPDC088789 TaxID=3365899 RepID=UPI00381B2F6F